MTLTRRSLSAVALLLAFAAFSIALAQSGPRGDARDATRLTDALAIRAGSIVGEIGAGDGTLTIAISRVVGDTGRVFASELGEDRIAALTRAVERAGVSNVRVLPADPIKTNFEAGCCDVVFMRNVYHHFDDPRAMNASLFESLRPGGMLGVMDFAPRGKPATAPVDRDIEGSHGVVAETIANELKEAGFEIVSTETAEEREVFVIARKPARD